MDLRKIPGEINPADLFTKHLASRDRLRALVKLLGCQYMDGRAATAPLTRTAESGRTTMAEANSLENEPVMPHMMYTPEDLDVAYPSMSAPEDIDTGDEECAEGWDLLYQEGLKVAEQIRRRAAEIGRKRYEESAQEHHVSSSKDDKLAPSSEDGKRERVDK